MLPNIIQQVIMTVRSKEPFKCYATRGNAVGVGGVSAFPEKALRMCTVQRYYRYEGLGGGVWGYHTRKKTLRNIKMAPNNGES